MTLALKPILQKFLKTNDEAIQNLIACDPAVREIKCSNQLFNYLKGISDTEKPYSAEVVREAIEGYIGLYTQPDATEEQKTFFPQIKMVFSPLVDALDSDKQEVAAEEIQKWVKEIHDALSGVCQVLTDTNDKPYKGFEALHRMCEDAVQMFPSTLTMPNLLSKVQRIIVDLDALNLKEKAPYYHWRDCKTIVNQVSYVAYLIENVMRGLINILSCGYLGKTERSNYFFAGPNKTF